MFFVPKIRLRSYYAKNQGKIFALVSFLSKLFKLNILKLVKVIVVSCYVFRNAVNINAF